MGKKVVLAVFGGVALLGLVMSIVGWALGGEVGSLRVEDGEMIYHTSHESKKVGNAPYWANGDYMMMDWRGWGDVWDEITDTRVVEEYEVAGTTATLEGMPDGSDFFETTGETITIAGPEKVVDIPAGVESMDISIELGYLVIKQGDTLGLTVRGPLSFESHSSDNSSWEFYSDADEEHNIKTKTVNGELRFFRGSEDLTTVFTLTLPSEMPQLSASMNLGQMTVKNIRAGQLDLQMDVGSMLVNGVAAAEADIYTSVGAVKAQGVTANTCSLRTEVGSIEFAGQVNSYLDINSEVGSVSAVLAKPEGGYYATTQADIGTITLDGKNTLPGSSHTFGNENAYSLEMDLQCGVGSIEVQFAGNTVVAAAAETADAAPEAPEAPEAPVAPVAPVAPGAAQAAEAA